MIDKNSFANFSGRTIESLYLIMWPPLRETREIDVDITFGFKFEKANPFMISICIDKNDLWTPIVKMKIADIIYEGEFFYDRLKMWMMGDKTTNEKIKYEFYDVSFMTCFSEIVSKKIIDVQFLFIEENETEPFGVKFSFEKDYILFFPNSTGTTIETSEFNKNDNLSYFQKMGKIRFISHSAL